MAREELGAKEKIVAAISDQKTSSQEHIDHVLSETKVCCQPEVKILMETRKGRSYLGIS